jgi:hypothetical protein
MGEPFPTLDEGSLDEGARALKQQIERDYAELGGLFDQLRSSDERLKTLPGLPYPSLSAVLELATVQSLRGLELTRGAGHLLQDGNLVAVLPVIRSLFETWILLIYSEARFRELVVEGNRWDRFDELAMRLLRARDLASLQDRRSSR